MVVTLPPQLDASALATLADTLECASASIVLTGTGEVFCSGLALDVTPEKGVLEHFLRCVRAVRCGPPAVAFVDGAARGAGVGLAAACDRVLVTERASFGLPELYFGLTPAAIWPLLRERVRAAELRWLAISGETVGAARAIELGLADRRASELAEVEPLLRPLLRACPDAIRLLKRSTAPTGAVAVGAEMTRQRLAEPSVRARIARFLEGGAPWE